MLRFWHEWDWDGAEESYREAIRLNPNEPGALHDHGWLLITRGKFAEGIAEIRRAQELDPVSPRANMHVAWAYTYTRRYAERCASHEARWSSRPATRKRGIASSRPMLSGNYESALAAQKRTSRAGRRAIRSRSTNRCARAAKTLDPRDPYENAVKLA
jgi:type IV pilus assembly protein PilF